MIRSGLIILATLCQLKPAGAREDLVPGSRFITGRAAALADAYLPTGEDGAAALFYNPAVAAKFKDPQFEPLNLQFYGDSGYLGSFSITNPTFYKVTSLSDFLPTLQANPGTYMGVGGALLPNFTMRGLALGMLFQTHLGAAVNPDGTVHYRSTYQLIPTISGALRLADGIVRIGYNLQWVNQAVGNLDQVSASTSNLGYNQNLTQGSGLSHNFGFALTLPYKYLPSLNLVARNVLSVNYGTTCLFGFTPNSTGAPRSEPTSFDASLSIQPKLGYGGFINLVLEYRDITNTSNDAIMGRLAASMEISYRELLFLRGGWGSGYPAAGIGLRRKGSEFSLSYYSEELGSSYQTLQDTRFLMQYQIKAF